MRCPRHAFTLAALLGAGGLQAQEVVRPGEPPAARDTALAGNAAATLFERSRNTFNWTGFVNLDTTAWGTGIRFRQIHGSNIILLESAAGGRVKSDQSYTALGLSRFLSPSVGLRAGVTSRVYTDDKAVGLSSVSTHIVTGGMIYSPMAALSVSPAAGYRWDVQGDRSDRGPRFALEGRLQELLLDGYRLSGELRLEEDRPSPRRLGTRGLQAGVRKSFEGGTRDSFAVGVFRTQREFYAGADSAGVDSRVEHALTVSNLLDYDAGGPVASLFVGLWSRTLERETRALGVLVAPPGFGAAMEEFRLETFVQLACDDCAGGGGFVRLLHAERTESHEARASGGSPQGSAFNTRNEQERTKNNVARRTVLSGSVAVTGGLTDTLRGAASASILRYDTPSRDNTEDRDEQLFAVTLSGSHRFGRTFLLGVELDGTMSHTVYLLPERSAGNSRNRILRLCPRTVFRPSSDVATVNAFEVLANYTVHDFEAQSALARSFSYRQFAWYDSTSLELTRRVGIDVLGSLKFSERGQLNWEEFTERTENAFEDRLLFCQLRWSPAAGTVFAVGYRAFLQRRYGYASGERTLDAELRSTGPTCAVLWEAGAPGRISLLGWYERRTQNAAAARSLANLSLTVQLTL